MNLAEKRGLTSVIGMHYCNIQDNARTIYKGPPLGLFIQAESTSLALPQDQNTPSVAQLSRTEEASHTRLYALFFR